MISYNWNGGSRLEKLRHNPVKFIVFPHTIVKTIQDMSHHFKLICDNYESHRTQYYIHASLVPPSEKTPSFVQAITSIHSCTINQSSTTIPIHPLE